MSNIPCAICCRDMCVCTHADMMFPSTFRPDPVKDENHRLRTELAEWRNGTRRVHWRVRGHDSERYGCVDCFSKQDARNSRLKSNDDRVYRVTVKPKGAK